MCTFPHRFTYPGPTSTLHCCSLNPCHRTFESSVIANEASCIDQYTTPHPHHSNNTEQHSYLNAHQWRHPISIQQSIGLND